LAAAEPSGPVDGFLNGVEGGTGTKVGTPPPPPPPPPKPEPVIKPVANKNNPQPPYPAVAKRRDVEGVVVVSFDVLENGSVANPKIVSGPEEFHDSVLKTVARWRFTPAKRGGIAMRFRTSTSIRFRLDDA
jgi:protein TonB